jgi:spermidine synthase
MRERLPPFLMGFLALSFQIILLREFSAHFYGNEISFGFILGSWLLWGGLGSILGARLKSGFFRLSTAYYYIILVSSLSLTLLRFSRFMLGTLPGEVTGMAPMLLYSFGLSFLISFPLGALFVFNARFLEDNVTRVYLLETMGSAAAGFVVYFLFIPAFSNWHTAALVGAFVSAAVFFSFGRRRQIVLFLFVLLVQSAFWSFDLPSQKIFWRPFQMIESKDTPFGKLQVIRTREQLSLYNNTLLIYSSPDLPSSEESVHFALLQRPGARSVLLIGGGAGGTLSQILKYPDVETDYVEIDPEIIRFSLKYLPEEEKDSLQNKRVHIHYLDGRAYLNKSGSTYDVIVLNLPDPSTAQINRFYTKEFFLRVYEKLTPGGVFSFRVSSAENYIGPELRHYLSSLYFTLKDVFPEVKIVPGDTNIFLASSGPISLDHRELVKKIDRLGLKNKTVNSSSLFSRLSPLRLEFLKDTVTEGQKSINHDLVPISYFYHSVVLSTQFHSPEASVLRFLMRLGRFWLLDFPLMVFVLVLIFMGVRRQKSFYLLMPLAVMGLTTMTAEIIILIAYQTSYGYLYQRVALLFACFMVGLFLGAFRGKARRTKEFLQLLIIQFGLILLLSLLLLWLESHPPEIFFFLFLLFLGYLGGDLFIVSNHLYMMEKKNPGIGYGMDLLGSFSGALAVSSFLIPLVGLPVLAKYIFLLNSFCFLFLLRGKYVWS